jgi:hypothetical protein
MMSVAWGWLIAEQRSGRANHSREAEENSRQHHNVATIVREEDDRKMGWTGGVPAREQASGISVIFFL